jgi:hypothetical protein
MMPQGSAMMPQGSAMMPPGGSMMPPGGTTTTGQTNVTVGGTKNNSKKNNSKKNNSKKEENNNSKKNNSNKEKNNDGNNNSNKLSNKNKNNNNNQNTLNNLNNEIKERISSIKLTDNSYVIAYWICWLLCIIVIMTTFITTPIRYSEEEPIYKVSYNRLYYYLTIILIGLLCYYAYTARERLPLIYGEDIYIKVVPIIVLFLGFIVISIYDSPSEKEDGAFNTPPTNIVKNKKIMIVQYVLLLLLIFTLIGIDIYKSADGFNNMEPFHINRAIPAFITILGVSLFLYKSVKYNVKRYNLPKTWSK